MSNYAGNVSTHRTMSITIDLDNAVFDGDIATADELLRIFHRLANCVNYGRTAGLVHDINGNPVGEWAIDEYEVLT